MSAASPSGRESGRVPFGERLTEAMGTLAPVCVGIDPHPSLLNAWGLDANVDGLMAFTMTCVEALAGTAAVIKPQVAFFEAYGSAGLAVLERARADITGSGSLVLMDAKRGDIGSTMSAYAAAWLHDDSPLAGDAVTLSPYLGYESLRPALTLARDNARGVFVLAATSNPEAPATQDSMMSDGTRLCQSIVDSARADNEAVTSSADDVGHVGLVIGATVTNPPMMTGLRGAVLLPGVGAQGASIDDARRVAGHDGVVAVPSVSRAILSAGPTVAALKTAVHRCVGDE